MKRNDVLVVIDMQNVYLPGQSWACPSMPESTRHIQRLLDAGVAGQVVFTKFTAAQHPEGTWRAYNKENAVINADPWLNEIVDELQPYLSRFPVYEKSVYSSMKIRELAEAARHAEHLVLTGVVAECCILSTMMEAIDLGSHVIYLEDCISGQTAQNEAAIRKIAESFAPMHTLVMSSEEYLSAEISRKAGRADGRNDF